jgi:hypothetical protein
MSTNLIDDLAAVAPIIESLPPAVQANLVDAIRSAIGSVARPLGAPIRAWLEGKAAVVKANSEARVAIIEAIGEAATLAAQDDPELARRALAQWGDRLVKEQMNRESVLREAATEIGINPPRADSSRRIEEDWLYSFWRLAETKSNPEVQWILGRILAGEIGAPGTFSPASLAVLSTLTPSLALRFENLARLAIVTPENAFVIHPSVFVFQNIGPLDSFDISYDDLFELEGAQLIRSAETIMFNYASDAESIEAEYGGQRVLFSPAGKQLQLIQLTRAGRELRSVIALEPHDAYSVELIQKLGDGFRFVDGEAG